MPDLPHHVTQRGNERETVFFEADAEPGISQLVSVDLSRSARMPPDRLSQSRNPPGSAFIMILHALLCPALCPVLINTP